MQNQFIQELARAETEIRALKTAQKIPSLIRGYSFTFTVASDGSGDVYGNGMYQYVITYGDGDQPILSEFYYDGVTWQQEPSGNTQRVFFWAQMVNECTIVSTRPILSAVKVV